MMIITVVPNRAGFHMLHSMIARDRRVLDTGNLRSPRREEILVPYDGGRPLPEFLVDYERAHPKRIILSNVKFLDERPDILAWEGAVFLHQYRRNLLDQIASTLIAGTFKCWVEPPKSDISVRLDPEWARLSRDYYQRCFDMTTRALKGLPVARLSYEDVTPAKVRKALEDVGQVIATGAATTPKVSPPFSKCITNWDEFDPADFELKGV